MPTSRLICATEEEKIVGSISLNTLRTPGWPKPSRNRGRSPSRPIAGQSSSICAAPPPNTPQASAFSGGATWPASSSMAAITARLCSTGVKAGRPKRRKVLSTPPARAVMEMNAR